MQTIDTLVARVTVRVIALRKQRLQQAVPKLRGFTFKGVNKPTDPDVVPVHHFLHNFHEALQQPLFHFLQMDNIVLHSTVKKILLVDKMVFMQQSTQNISASRLNHLTHCSTK